MCPIKEGPHLTPEQKAIQTVIEENKQEKIANNSNSNRKKETPNNLLGSRREREHKFKNCLTAEINYITDSKLIAYGREYIKWAETTPEENLPLKSSFWRSKGINEKTLDGFCSSNEDLKLLVQAGNEYCGDIRERRLKDYWQHIANRQSVYVPEYKRHDKEMIELRERIKHQIDKEDEPTRQEWATLFAETFGPMLGEKKKNATESTKTSNNRLPDKSKV